MLLVVGCGIGDHVVVQKGTRVPAILGIERHQGFAGLSFLRGDHHHTVGTTSTIKGVRGSVLQDCHRLDVVRVDVGHVAAVGSTVDDDQRVLACVQRTETADADRGRTRGVTAAGGQLHTRNRTGQSTSDTRGLCQRDVLGSNGLGRTREGRLLCRTEGHDDHLVECALIACQHDTHVRTGTYLDGLHAQVGDAEHVLALRTSQREVSVNVGGNTCLCANDLHGCTHNGFAVVLRHYGTTHLHLCHCTHCCEQQGGQKHC